ncbi:endo-1,4-beta-xylanase [Stratiformator vulcanicus]|uniref:GH10 domain-containing protein n=1 Tax=Stratiformator vulcanicus TaxID=2527980 RepID=A0A517R4N5_9PLAN|nr:endo-1,4-beta-xylanase [Stratiformator vulcanicus]QDT38847.1 hypothetical protein Pan189_32460 [Stratiformator vulcanicus]
MAELRFRLADPNDPAIQDGVSQAHFSTAEGQIHQVSFSWDGEILICDRPMAESGKLTIPWLVPGYGRLMLSTASLMQRDEPYFLPLELARGKLVQLRDQLSAWSMNGMTIPGEIAELLRIAHRHFALAATSQDDVETASAEAAEALRVTKQTIDVLTASFSDQRLKLMPRRHGSLPAALMLEVNEIPTGDAESTVLSGFGTTSINFRWPEIEENEGDRQWEKSDRLVDWCEQHRRFIVGGPLLDLGPAGLPQWALSWSDDPNNLQSLICDFVESAISRYAGRIRRWQIATCAASGGGVAVTEEQRLVLAARAIEVARQVDTECELFLRIDRPWGEYRRHGKHRVSPIQFIDAMTRSGVRLGGLTLEYAVGYRPGGSERRDEIELSRLVDTWSKFGLPLSVMLRFPNQFPDPKDTIKENCQAITIENADEAAQAEWLLRTAKFLAAKQPVVSIDCGPLIDPGMDSAFPASGLCRDAATPRQALSDLAALGNAKAAD